jgi:hypothetical protein
MPTKKSKSKSKTTAKTKPKKKAPSQVLSPEEKKKSEKMEMIGAYLEEVFHLAGHAIEAGTESENPWSEILAAVITIHNHQDENEGHKILALKATCECGGDEKKIELKEYVHDCH